MAKTFIITETPVKPVREQFKGSDNDKVKIIDSILNMYPQLKRDRNIIINSVLGRIEKPTTAILEKVTHNNRPYYKDDEGKLFDVDVKLRGCYEIIKGEYKFYFFENDTAVRDAEEVKNLIDTFYKAQK